MTPAGQPVIHRDPEILGGTPVFVGTRVPAQALIDYLEGGHSLDEFLDDFRQSHATRWLPRSSWLARHWSIKPGGLGLVTKCRPDVPNATVVRP